MTDDKKENSFFVWARKLFFCAFASFARGRFVENKGRKMFLG